MVSHLVVYQLGLIVLVWVFLMLYGLWPSDPVAPLVSRRSRLPGCSPLLLHSRRFLRHEAAAVTSTPRVISVPIPTVAMGAGSGWAISRPTVIPVAVPGDSALAAHGTDIFLRRMGSCLLLVICHFGISDAAVLFYP